MGGFLALLAAATFALNNTMARRGVLTGSVMQAMAISVPLGVPLLLVATLVFGGYDEMAGASAATLTYLALAGIVHFVVGRYCNYRAVKAIGANLAGPLTETSVIVALALAVVLLGERLTLLKVLGIALILAGPALTVERDAKKKNAAAAQLKFTPLYVEGYIFAGLAAVAYGVSPILVRFALEGGSWRASVAGGLVSYTAATLALVAVVIATGQARHVFDMPRETVKWFCWAGVFVGLSQMLRYMALSLAPVSVVSPIQRLSLIFRLVFSYMLNRKYEVFHSKMVLGTVVSLIGAVLLSLSIDAVQAYIPIPDALAPLFTSAWP